MARMQAYNESLGEKWLYNSARRYAPSPDQYPYYPEPPVQASFAAPAA